MRKNIYLMAGLVFALLVTHTLTPVAYDESDPSYRNDDQKLNILIITDKFPHQSRQYINNQITGFIELGHNVFILARQQGPDDNDPIIEECNLAGKIFYGKLPQDLRAFDILYCQFGQMGDYCLRRIEKNKLLGKMVVCFRGGDATRALKQNAHRFDKVFKKAALLLPVCSYFRDRLLSCGAKAFKTIVHHSAIDCAKIKFRPRTMPKDRVVKFVTLARLAKMKGIEYAIQAIDRVRKIYPHVYYEIIGDGELYDSLNDLISSLQLQNVVKLIGYLPHDVAMQKLDEFHIALVPSCTADNWNQEGIPNAAMEAMAAGMPVIGTHHAGISELIEDGVSGFLVPEKNIQALTEKILFVISKPQLWEAVGTAGRAYILKEHNKHVANEKVIELFKSLVRDSI